MKMKTLTQTIAVALLGGSMAAWQPAAATTTMYNTFAGASDSDTDGWNYGGIGNPTYPTPSPGWVGVPSGTLPFGYTSQSWLNWAIDIDSTGSWEISKTDALNTYGVSVDLDTNKGSYHDFGNSFGTPQGWAHNTDIGLLKNSTSIPLQITLTIANDEASPSFNNFGMTIFQGMPTTSSPNHHATWNKCTDSTCTSYITTSNPFGLGGLTYVAHTDVRGGLFNTLSFTAAPGQIYSIFLGGAQAGSVFFPTNDYKIAVSAVPVPAALWLFGGALLGWAGLRRQRT